MTDFARQSLMAERFSVFMTVLFSKEPFAVAFGKKLRRGAQSSRFFLKIFFWPIRRRCTFKTAGENQPLFGNVIEMYGLGNN